MTLSDVYCRFNRARGMEVCNSSGYKALALNSRILVVLLTPFTAGGGGHSL